MPVDQEILTKPLLEREIIFLYDLYCNLWIAKLFNSISISLLLNFIHLVRIFPCLCIHLIHRNLLDIRDRLCDIDEFR